MTPAERDVLARKFLEYILDNRPPLDELRRLADFYDYLTRRAV